LVVALVVWVAVAGVGFVTLALYETAPGDSGAAPATWPQATTLPAPEDRPALVVLAHPQCPCTRASIAELERLMRDVYGHTDAYVLFLQPASASEEWVESDLWRHADRIPGVRAVRDPGGHEARRFGAATSGHAVLYDADGRLRFSGGLTASRGHEGDNEGRAALTRLLTENDAERGATPIYGCPLQDPRSN
jgi:hypothetical protein